MVDGVLPDDLESGSGFFVKQKCEVEHGFSGLLIVVHVKGVLTGFAVPQKAGLSDEYRRVLLVEEKPNDGLVRIGDHHELVVAVQVVGQHKPCGGDIGAERFDEALIIVEDGRTDLEDLHASKWSYEGDPCFFIVGGDHAAP